MSRIVKLDGTITNEFNDEVTRTEFTRRSFLIGAGVTAAGLALLETTGCAPKPESKEANNVGVPEDLFADATPYYASCSPECQHHNLKALVKDGKIVAVDTGIDNESLPCMRGRARVNLVNSPDRLTMPLLRDGEKGEGKWKEISWDEALDLIVSKLQETIETVGNKGIVHESHAGNFHLLAGQVGPAFMSRIGGYTSLSGTLCCAAVYATMIPMWGKRFLDTRETIEDADFILVWGNNPVITMNGYWPRFAKALKNGAKMIVIDPLRNESAARATEWLPIKPTTDTALALGMLKVIVDENLHDVEFLTTKTTAPCLIGSDAKMVLLDEADELSYAVIDEATNDLARHDAPGVRPLLSLKGTAHENQYTTIYDLTVAETQPWTPEAVEAETGVPAADVARIAREYATAEKSMIVQNMGGFMRVTYGSYAVASQLNLAVFTGQVGRAGTGVCDAGGINSIIPAKPMFDNPKMPEGMPKITRVRFADHVLNDQPNPINVLISRMGSMVDQYPNSGKVIEALKKIPFVVVIDNLMTSTGLYADLVLPSTMVFETEDLLLNARSHLIQLSEKAVDPPGEAHDDLWIFTELAKRMGVGEDLDHEHRYFIEKALVDTGYTYDQLAEKKSIDAYPDGYIPFKDGEFLTKSKKCELYQPQWVKNENLKPVPTYIRHAEIVGGSSGLDSKYPLAVTQRKSHRTVHSTFAYSEMIDAIEGAVPTIVINDQDAAARGIANGDTVTVFNDRGTHSGVAEVTNQVMQGVLVVENGWTEKYGGSSSHLTNDNFGPIFEEHCCNETLADVRKGE